MEKKFTFKQFEIIQQKTAMKLSTDAVLLGSWAECQSPKNILDIGTGTGILSLMTAQRFAYAHITTVEIDKDACIEAEFNFKNSQWNNRIELVNQDFLEFATNYDRKFDFIITNPPYFEKHLGSPDQQKHLARHTDSLPLDLLIKNVSLLMHEKSTFAMILPFSTYNRVNLICNRNKLFCNRKMVIIPAENKNPNRIMMQYSQNPTFCNSSEIKIRKNYEYTQEFLQLTKEFYLFA